MTDNNKAAATFGQIVAEARRKKGLTQAQVATAIGKTEGFISLVENGHEKSAAAETVVRWADALGLNRKRLLQVGAPFSMHRWRSVLAEAAARDEKGAA